MLWGEAMAKGYSAPVWMSFRQAMELNAHVRKGEHGSSVVYANTLTRTGTDEANDPVPEILIPYSADRGTARAILRAGGTPS